MRPPHREAVGSRRAPHSGAVPALVALLCCLGVAFAMQTAIASQETNSDYRQGSAFELTEENDALVGTDRHYTQGLRLAYTTADNAMPEWLLNFSRGLPALGFDVTAHRFGLEVGQSIYTPADRNAIQLVVNDRPYAGWLYTGFFLQRRGVTPVRGTPVLEHLRFNLGVIGPESLAEDAQEFFHRLMGEQWPQGWRNQLHTEPGLALRYHRAWRFAQRCADNPVADFIPFAGASVGNVDTSFRAGGTARVGWNLPDDFGVQNVDSLALTAGGYAGGKSRSRCSVYLYAGAEGKAVLYTTLLDGNLFRASHHVDKEYLVADLKTGIAVDSGRFEAALSVIYRTREFVGQRGNDAFGSLQLRVMF